MALSNPHWLLHPDPVLEIAFRPDPQSGQPVYRQLEEHLRELLDARRLVVGERLPPTRELAERLGLSRNTVSRAYQALIDEGIYKEIAIALHTPPHRAVSLALVAQALGATKDAVRLAARRGSSRRTSFSSPLASSGAGGGGGGAAAAAHDVELAAV